MKKFNINAKDREIKIENVHSIIIEELNKVLKFLHIKFNEGDESIENLVNRCDIVNLLEKMKIIKRIGLEIERLDCFV